MNQAEINQALLHAAILNQALEQGKTGLAVATLHRIQKEAIPYVLLGRVSPNIPPPLKVALTHNAQPEVRRALIPALPPEGVLRRLLNFGPPQPRRSQMPGG
jgi:hypothetical protein